MDDLTILIGTSIVLALLGGFLHTLSRIVDEDKMKELELLDESYESNYQLINYWENNYSGMHD